MHAKHATIKAINSDFEPGVNEQSQSQTKQSCHPLTDLTAAIHGIGGTASPPPPFNSPLKVAAVGKEVASSMEDSNGKFLKQFSLS